VSTLGGGELANRVDVFAECPAGKRAIAGGYQKEAAENLNTNILTSAPLNNGWMVTAVTTDFPNPRHLLVQAFAICAYVAP